ncbi:uncharacterized protein VTP21DRAFT_3648 [Calcarisporiella thermophila]|uniref:uncharacterized protein n=1 Tax=Calcarisporiella thermophila TaxID=911321 RepID=UPI0037439BE9
MVSLEMYDALKQNEQLAAVHQSKSSIARFCCLPHISSLHTILSIPSSFFFAFVYLAVSHCLIGMEEEDPRAAAPPSKDPAHLHIVDRANRNSLRDDFELRLFALRAIPNPQADLCQTLYNDCISTLDIARRLHECACVILKFVRAATIATRSLRVSVREMCTIGLLPMEDAVELEGVLAEFGAVFEVVSEVEQRLSEKLDAETEPRAEGVQMAQEAFESVARAKEGWQDLQLLLGEVRREMNDTKAQRELQAEMDEVLHGIDELSTTIFRYHEDRLLTHAYLHHGPCGGFEDRKAEDELWLAQIDARVEPLFARIDGVYARLTGPDAPRDLGGMLEKKYKHVQGRWETLKKELDDLKEQLKEDRWLAFFNHIAGQVMSMMRQLSAALVQGEKLTAHAPSTAQRPSLAAGGKLRHSKSCSSLKASQEVPSDSVHEFAKTLEAKRCYYEPAIERMIHLLANSIASKGMIDPEVAYRHIRIRDQWVRLKQTLEEIERKLSSLLHPPPSGNQALPPAAPALTRRASLGQLRRPSDAAARSNLTLTAKSKSRPSSRSSSASTLSPRLGDRPRWNPSTKMDSPPGQSFLDRPPSRGVAAVERSLSRSRSRSRTRNGTSPSPGPDLNLHGMRRPSAESERYPSTAARASRPSSRTNRAHKPSTPPPIPPIPFDHQPSPTTSERSDYTDVSIDRRLSSCTSASSCSSPPRPRTPTSPLSALAAHPKASPHGPPKHPHQPPPIFVHSHPNRAPYSPDPRDPLDQAVARILSQSLVQVQCLRIASSPDETGRYKFGTGRETYLCRLARFKRGNGGKHEANALGGDKGGARVLVRVGDGWRDLELFLMDRWSTFESV